jgi:hypothetical protein
MSKGKPPLNTRFSSTNQPDPEKKRVPKYKTRLKKFFNDNLPVVEEQMKKGNSQFWNYCKEWAYGKEVEIVEMNISDKTIIQILVDELKQKGDNEVSKDN